MARELVFAPLGGVGEIGMNLALYGIGEGNSRKWIAVDLGVSFAGEELPGIDLIMPDIAFLIAERRNLLGLVLTHAHEDHFGALLDLWPRLRCPVYATPFTASLLAAKREGEPGALDVPVKVVPLGGALHARRVRHRAGFRGALDPGVERADHPHAARQRAAHRRLEARSDPGDRPADRRGEAQGAGR